MKKFKWIVSAALILVCSLCFMLFANDASAEYRLGDKIDDFTVSTYDGRTITLSEALEEKDMVLINIWATWCGPCRMEFPFMEEAYQQYSDRIEIIALSCEPTDSDEVLSQFVAETGMSFPVGQDTPNLASAFGVTGIPTSIVIDRNGVICFIHSGAVTETAMFTRLFDVFVGDGYSDPVLLNTIPSVLPNVEHEHPENLFDALDDESSSIEFGNPESKSVWPMTITELDGRTVVAPTNAGVDDSTAEITAAFTADAGDALVITFKTDTVPVFDLMQISINGEPVKFFGGEHDWMSYAWPIETAGDYTAVIRYIRDNDAGMTDDMIWIDSISLVSGADAESALSANPAYPVSDRNHIAPLNPEARQIYIDDPDGLLAEHFGSNAEYYILNASSADFGIMLNENTDPEAVMAFSNYDGNSWAVTELLTDEGYVVHAYADSLETTGYNYTSLFMFDMTSEDPMPVCTTYFADEANLISFAASVTGSENGWRYADTDAENVPETVLTEDGKAVYTLRFVDQNGSPVAGVMAQVCDDEMCAVYTSDENGECTFELDPYEYEIHLLKLPDGYSGDTGTITYAPANGGEINFEITKN